MDQIIFRLSDKVGFTNLHAGRQTLCERDPDVDSNVILAGLGFALVVEVAGVCQALCRDFDTEPLLGVHVHGLDFGKPKLFRLKEISTRDVGAPHGLRSRDVGSPALVGRCGADVFALEQCVPELERRRGVDAVLARVARSHRNDSNSIGPNHGSRRVASFKDENRSAPSRSKSATRHLQHTIARGQV